MIQIKQETIGEIPVLQVVQADKMDAALPTVVYYHGFRGEKESSLTLAYKLASIGIRVVLPDSPLHGERRDNNMHSVALDLAFWDIVMDNIDELETIKTYLEETRLTIPGSIGVAGTSMGGITTFGALKKYSWIKVAAVLMGTPNMIDYGQTLIDVFNETNEEKITAEQTEETLQRLKNYDLSRNPERLQNRPLFIWHGAKDKVVPPVHSEQFYQNVKEQYTNDSLHFILEKDRSHHISRLSIAETTKWFQEHIM